MQVTHRCERHHKGSLWLNRFTAPPLLPIAASELHWNARIGVEWAAERNKTIDLCVRTGELNA